MTTFYCIIDGEPPEVRELFRRSCLQRNIRFETVHASSFDFSRDSPVQGGDLLYCVATTAISSRVEQHLQVVGIRSFGADREALQTRTTWPFVRSVICHGRNRGTIRGAVDSLGGSRAVTLS